MTVHHDDELRPKASIAGTVVSLWLVTVVLSVYGATLVADHLAGWERLASAPGMPALREGLVTAQRGIGVQRLHAGLEAVRHRINETYVVGQKADEPVEIPVSDPPIVEAPDETHPAHRRAPAKHRVLVIGASSIQFALGVELERRFPMYENVKVKRFGQLATSLARPDFFDWPKKAKELIAEFKPDLIVTNYGGNDAQDILREDGAKVLYDTPDWDPAFRTLVTELIGLARNNGADTVMIGMPVMREDKFTAKMRRLNKAMKEATEAAGALYVSAWELSSTAKGEYLTSAYYKGRRGLLRTSDGVHYSKLGAEMIVDSALALIERRFTFVPKDPKLAAAEPHAFESKVLGRWVSYVAYRPRTSPENAPATPLVILRPNAEAQIPEDNSHPHSSLQTLAQAETLTLVLMEPFELAEANPALFERELRADSERHCPSSGGLVGTIELGKSWRTELETAVKNAGASLRAATP